MIFDANDHPVRKAMGKPDELAYVPGGQTEQAVRPVMLSGELGIMFGFFIEPIHNFIISRICRTTQAFWDSACCSFDS